MPVCPKCKSEYRDGFTRCDDCEVDLVENLLTEEVTDFIEFYSCPDRMEAEKLRAELVENKIGCNLHVVESSSFPTGGGVMSVVHLFIDNERKEQAREIIEEFALNKEISDKGMFLEN